MKEHKFRPINNINFDQSQFSNVNTLTIAQHTQTQKMNWKNVQSKNELTSTMINQRWPSKTLKRNCGFSLRCSRTAECLSIGKYCSCMVVLFVLLLQWRCFVSSLIHFSRCYVLPLLNFSFSQHWSQCCSPPKTHMCMTNPQT